MKDEEFDVNLPFGREARREAIRNYRLSWWGKRLFTAMMLSFLIGTAMLNSIILIANNAYIWYIATILLNAGLCSGIVLMIIVGKWG